MQLDSDILEERYNRNVELYNDNKRSHEEILNIFSNNVLIIQERIDDLVIKVNDEVDYFKIELESIVNESLYISNERQHDSPKQNEEATLLMKEIFQLLDFNIKTQNYINQPEKVYKELSIMVDELCVLKGIENQKSTPITNIRNLLSHGKKIKQLNSQVRAYKGVINQIIDGLFPSKLKSYKDLPDTEKKVISEGYTPHHNTREDLIDDIRKILSDIRTQPRFFHKDGTIKHTTVAEYAVSQLWFAQKHGYGERGLRGHIKKTYRDMKNNYSS